MSAIQTQLSERALELLNLPEDGPPLFLLDIGCGTALSGQVLEEAGLFFFQIQNLICSPEVSFSSLHSPINFLLPKQGTSGLGWILVDTC